MTAPDWVNLENTRNIAVIVAALLAALTYVNGKRQETRARRANEIEYWVRTIIHSLFQRSAEKQINFDTIVSQARNDAIAYKKYKVNADEMSSEYIRRIVVGMVSSRVISQVGNDLYSLTTLRGGIDEMSTVMAGQTATMFDFFNDIRKDRDPAIELTEKLSNVMMAVTTKMVTDNEVRDEVLRQVTDDPFRYSRTDLILRVVQATGAANEVVKAKTADMLVSKQLSKDSSGRIGPASLDGPNLIEARNAVEDGSGRN